MSQGPEYTKTIICLANSRKIAGRCVAGKEISAGKIGEWIRPISGRPAGELSEEERRFQNGKDPKLRDIITIPMIEPRPHGFQVENHLIDSGYYWSKVGEATWAQLEGALDANTGPLWDNSSSSYSGRHDRVAETAAAQLDSSLRLIEVNDLRIAVSAEGAAFGNSKRKVRGKFTYSHDVYWLSVTDPAVERKFFCGDDGEYGVGNAILCISLGEPYEGYAYKLIAAVFTEQ